MAHTGIDTKKQLKGAAGIKRENSIVLKEIVDFLMVSVLGLVWFVWISDGYAFDFQNKFVTLLVGKSGIFAVLCHHVTAKDPSVLRMVREFLGFSHTLILFMACWVLGRLSYEKG